MGAFLGALSKIQPVIIIKYQQVTLIVVTRPWHHVKSRPYVTERKAFCFSCNLFYYISNNAQVRGEEYFE